MAQSPNAIVFTGAVRRVRVLCTGPLATPAAFQSLSYYGVQNLDGLGANPIHVEAVFAIGSDPNAFELQVDSNFTDGALYQVNLTALPFADTSTFTGSIQGATAAQVNTPAQNSEIETTDEQLLLYGRDHLLTDEGDFAEDATGDLASSSGRDVWQADVLRDIMSSGVPWDPSYGANPDDFVNAPDVYQLPLSARILTRCRADNRTKSATVTLQPTLGGNIGVYGFLVNVVGIDNLDPLSLPVPLPTNVTTV